MLSSQETWLVLVRGELVPKGINKDALSNLKVLVEQEGLNWDQIYKAASLGRPEDWEAVPEI